MSAYQRKDSRWADGKKAQAVSTGSDKPATFWRQLLGLIEMQQTPASDAAYARLKLMSDAEVRAVTSALSLYVARPRTAQPAE